ncbi:TRM11 family SAM-dependent methyltransferase [Ferruginivarius sediminum]|uniref:site-specific DNA-methyltransferase (adenine-specific) n=1 Tax=Ferruginivarius sediminum TaxID=2661937 RepID=A0A369TB84_9PROT|nr:hypothetical protein DRB17_13255 [Ferruginivarius sediminum]
MHNVVTGATKRRRTWQHVDGAIPIQEEVPGSGADQIPVALACDLVLNYTAPGHHILDPFCGFGTVLKIAHDLGRPGCGIELDSDRCQFAQQHLPNQIDIINADSRDVVLRERAYDCMITSPPFGRVSEGVRIVDDSSYELVEHVVGHCRTFIKQHGLIVVETANPRIDGFLSTYTHEVAVRLARIVPLVDEIIYCVDTGVDVVEGVQHSNILVFQNTNECP